MRRDLAELAAAGALRRVHGGALPPASPGPMGFKARLPDDVAAKRGDRRGRGRARSGPATSSRSSGGTTMLEVARQLPDDLEATVVTMGPDVAVAVADHPGLTVDVVGGAPAPAGADGHRRAEAVEALRTVRPDLCVVSACSLHPVVGLTLR